MDSRPYTVHIYEDQASRISKWTLQYPNIETGGDIFGLWINENEVVIQAVLGPGQNCRRTATSFFQDEQYLNSVGGSLIRNEGLCQVGSWLSHHTTNLPDPSSDDKDTVWQHLPTPGRFLLLIATIEMKTAAPKFIVQMGFNLFESTNEGNKVIPMKLEILQGQSPVRANEAISRQMSTGAEVHSEKMPHPEASVESGLARPKSRAVNGKDMKSDLRQDDDSDFFPGRQSGRQGYRQPMQEVITCEGVPPYITLPPSRHSEFRPSKPRHHAIKHERPAYAFVFKNLPNGREGMTLYHYDHPLGSCEDCRNNVVGYTRDGEMFVEEHISQGGIEDCCII
jgi:hypothetical protein